MGFTGGSIPWLEMSFPLLVGRERSKVVKNELCQPQA